MVVRPRLAEENDPVPIDIELFMAAVAAIATTTPFARLWTREEAEWQVQRRFGALSVGLRGRPKRGAQRLVMQTADIQYTVRIVDDVLWGTLLPDERLVLVAS